MQNKTTQEILDILIQHQKMSSSDIYNELTKKEKNVSLITVKRHLAKLAATGLIVTSGRGRTTGHEISVKGRVFYDVSAKEYCATEPDRRFGQDSYNFDLFTKFPTTLFSPDEIRQLIKDTGEYWRRSHDLPAAIKKKELERLMIELSWKSSRIEGNTYTLLDTEKLILENQAATDKTKEEAIMILNHKEAFNFVLQNASAFQRLTRGLIEELHKKLVKGLDIDFSLRNKPVGVIGSIYHPLDNRFQIEDALKALIAAVNKNNSPYGRALLAKIGIAYIQPFDDGNKRTGRLLANAILLANNLVPLSYRSVSEEDYREAMLTFYELNSIVPIKNIFIAQYDFAAKNYAL